MTSPIEERRKDDPRIAQLIADVAEIQKCLAANTELTQQIRDLLATFRVLAMVARWITKIGLAVSAVGVAAHQIIEWRK